MMLRQPAAALDDRWLSGVERYLASAVDELPPEQRRWLASRMSIELPPEVYRLADIGEWEQLIGRKAMERIRHGGPEDTIALLHERAERTPESPLFAIEARALLDLKQPAQAAQLLDRALAGFPVVGNPGRQAEILWLRAQASAGQGETGPCLAFLRRLADVTASMPTTLARVQALTEILGVLNPQDLTDVDVPEVARRRRALSEALGRLTEVEVDQESSLIRLALVRLGPHYPSLTFDLANRTVSDLIYLVNTGAVDLTPAVESIGGKVIDELGYLAAVDGAAIVGALIDQLGADLAQLSATDALAVQSITPIVEAVLVLLRAEGSSLSGSSLAGLDDYREPWELESTREVAS
jgi:hypothetical protein